MNDLKLGFGCVKALPDGVRNAWGARWIWPNDVVWDRQDLKGSDIEPLKDWLNGGALNAARIEAAQNTLHQDEDRTVVLFEDDDGVIVGNPQSSYGYLYVAAWLKSDAPTQPQFKEGDRVFSHYVMKWGTVESLNHTRRNERHGVSGETLPDTSWFNVRLDDGERIMLDDAHGNWDMARIVPPEIAERYGYGSDPKAVA